MNAIASEAAPQIDRAARFARCLKISKKAEWQIDRDLVRGRTLDFSRKFLPDGLSSIDSIF
jgi:hypothetical protein